jgi:hypothetical protein
MRRGFSGMLLLFLYLLPCSRISRRDSCSSSRASSSGGRSSFSKGPFGSCPSEEKSTVVSVYPSVPNYTNTGQIAAVWPLQS